MEIPVARRFAIGLLGVLVLTLVGCGGPQSYLPAAPASASTSATNSNQPTPTATPTPTPTPTIPVVVAATDIPRGTKITGDMVTIASYPLEQSPPHVFQGIVVLGTFATVAIYRGQPIYEQMVVSTASQVCKAT